MIVKVKKKILFIAPASIPCFGAESIVNVKLLSVLVEAGYEIDLVSKKSKWQFYPTTNFGLDNKLKSINIIEVNNKLNIDTILSHIMCYLKFGIVYKGSHWAYQALTFINNNLNLKVYDAVITKNYPSELIGYWLKKNKGIKWIATWNDPFPKDCYPVPYGSGFKKQPWYKRNILELMRDGPDYNVMPSERLAKYIDSYIHFRKETIKVIPHVAILSLSKELKSDKLRLLVSGTNNFPRNPKKLIDAYVRVANKFKFDSELVFLGVIDSDIEEYISDVDKSQNIKVFPPVTYEESLKVLDDYHVAVIIEADCAEGIFLPTKVVDFMQCEKPVLSISPKEGVLHDLYSKGNIGYFADCTDEDAIYNELIKIFSDFENLKLVKSSIAHEFLPDAVLKKYIEMIE